jgi:hypothetical protein
MRDVALQKFSPAHTSFQKSPIQHDEWLDDFVPAVKKPVTYEVDGEMVKVHPLYTNAQKYGGVARCVPPARYQAKAVQHMSRKIGHCVGYRRLTWDEAINGFDAMTPLVMSTACGYWSNHVDGKKSYFFDEDVQQMSVDGVMGVKTYHFSEAAKTVKHKCIGRAFVEYLNDLDAQVQKGTIELVPWVSTLKDELRPSAKAKVGKTRVFEQPGLEMTLLVRKYFGHFINHYKKHTGFDFYHGIGSDREAVWGHFYKEMATWDSVGFDLDYSNYDGTVQQFASECFLQIVDNFYGDEDKVARHTICNALRHKFHIVGVFLCESFMGNPSGNPMTDLYNSITNSVLILICYCICKESVGRPGNCDDFDKYVRMLTYGDDVIITQSPEVRAFFNRTRCAEICGYYGYKVTAAKKDAAIVDNDDLKELTFLKSPFVDDGDVVLAPLPVEVIHRELRWEHKANKGDQIILKQRIDTALRMAVHHGREFYDNLYRQIREAGFSSQMSYDDIRKEFVMKQHAYELQKLCANF